MTYFVAGTFHLHPLGGAAFFDRDEQTARLRPRRGTGTGTGRPLQPRRQVERFGSPLGRCALYAQLKGAGHARVLTVGGEQDERRIARARQSHQPHRHRARQRWRAVEHHEAKGAAAQQHIGAPGAARRVVGAHDPEAIVRAERGPVARGESAGGVHVRHPPSRAQRGGDELACDGGAPAAGGAGDFSEPAAREAVARKHRVECGHSGGQPRHGGAPPFDDLGELLTQGGNGHGHTNGRRVVQLPNKTRKYKG